MDNPIKDLKRLFQFNAMRKIAEDELIDCLSPALRLLVGELLEEGYEGWRIRQMFSECGATRETFVGLAIEAMVERHFNKVDQLDLQEDLGERPLD